MTFSNLTIYCTRKNFKKSHKSNKFKVSRSTSNKKLELPDWYSLADIQDYSDYIFKKHETAAGNPPITIYVNKIENKIRSKTETGVDLKLLKPETINLLACTKMKIIKSKNGENVPYLDITETILSHFHIVNSDYQYDTRVLFIFVLNMVNF